MSQANLKITKNRGSRPMKHQFQNTKSTLNIAKAIFIICIVFATNLLQAADAAPEEASSIFDKWLPKAFGVEVGTNAEGKVEVKKLPDLPALASNWYRCNGSPGKPISEVPVFSEVKDKFLFLELDFSAAWPSAKYAKRHVVYYLGADEPYAIVWDEIESDSNDFWTMQLSIPEETTPVNWQINFRDSDREADLLAGVAGEFIPEIALNKPVAGSAKAKSGSNMLLARLLKSNPTPNQHADKMSPMNIHIQNGRKTLTTEVQSRAPSISFALVPYVQTRSILPTTIISKTGLRMDWPKKSHQFESVPSENGSMALMIKDKRGSEIKRIAFRMEFEEIERPKGELVAAYDFESLTGNVVKDRVGGFDAQVERGKLIDGLEGQSIYLGFPDHPERNMVPAGITIPESIRQKLNAGHLTISFWYKPPMGQARSGKEWMWPIGSMMRGRKYLDTGFFNADHSHYKMGPFTKGFNAAWQQRADGDGVEPGKWNHLVFVMQEIDPAAHKYRYELYVNGTIRAAEVLGPINKNAKTWNQTNGPIMIGNLWGTIDNLQIYNNPLSEDEVLSIYEGELQKKVSYYSCDTIQGDDRVSSEPEGNYPRDEILDNKWVPESTFAATAKGATPVPGVKANALSLGKDGIVIPDKALWDLAQGSFTLSFYFKYTGKGCKIFNTKGIRLDINHNKLHGAIGNEWEDKYLGHKETLVAPDKWHHLVLTYDKLRMVMYLDGKLLYDRPMASKVGINFIDPIVLGGNCEIDDIHIYNHAIDENEVQKLAAYLPKE